MTGKDILQEEFEKSGMRGYKAEQVDSFLQKIAAFVDEQQVEINDLTYKIKILAEKIEEYKSEEGNIRDALLGAQKLGTSIMNEAKTKSEAMLLEARTTYDDMISQAKIKADASSREMLQKATSELNEMKRELEKERITFEKMKKEVSSFKASILKQYKTHLDLLTSLPSITNAQVAQTPVATPISEPIVAEKEEIRQTIVSTGERTRDIVADEQSKASFFDQDENTEIIEITRKKNDDSILENSFAKPQTLTSEILSNEKELDEEELDKAEMAQTKEFLNDAPEKTADDIADFVVNTEEVEQEDGEQQEFKINIGTGHQRPNYMEKFGKLEFGGFGNDK